MSAGKGFLKLLDIHDQADRLLNAMVAGLAAEHIPFRTQRFRADGFVRYRVRLCDMTAGKRAAQAVIELAHARPL